MLKVMTIVGTRPEIIRLSTTISKLDDYCDHVLVHTGQNFDYELNEIFFNDLDIRKPDVFLDAAGSNAAISISQIIATADKAMEDFQPDALLILGDTNSSLSAISAKRRKIPIFHMEAGNRCFDFRVPEEINRRIVDHISDINLTYSSIARDYLMREGLPPDQIIKTGSPMNEVLENYKENIISSSILTKLNLEPHKYFVVSAHREENVDNPKNLKKIINILDTLIEKYDYPIIFSTHPRTQKKLNSLGLKLNEKINFLKPFGFFDYVKLQIDAKCVLSDSGTITEESSILNFPALNIREVHERPEGFEEAAVIMTGLNTDLVLQSLELINHQPRNQDRLLDIVDDYRPSNVSEKVVRIILSYTDFINRKVWHKK
ncbi:UDP-N-acetylglucosamine 2-epimerase (non-hydrolyzing) [Gammaproteobacteria bacterium]|nr:UDP-N-acetylglucosamine 2-epimerase (non-hydrolyzing) [Gammaproteobacteria bacterium]